MTAEVDVAIVGAGIIGCAAARELASDHSVVVIDRGQVAGETTGHATGNTSVVTSFHEYPEYAHYANAFFSEYDGTGNFSYTHRPRITLVPPELEDRARSLARESADNGFETAYLSAEAVEAEYPGVFDLEGYVGGIHYRDIGWVDPYTFAVTLQEEAADAGAEFRTGVAVEAVTAEDGAVQGVMTDDGPVEAGRVVVAANWRSRALLAEHLELPVYPFRWQAVDLDPGELPLGDDYPMGLDPVTETYWRREHNGNLHVGGGEYRIANPGSVRDSVDESYRRKVAVELPDRLHGLEDAELVGEDTCPTGDATTPDTDPIIDAPEEGPSGLVVAVGFHGGGVMSAPSAGAGVRSLVTGELAPYDVDQFRLSRFETRSTDFAFDPLMAWD